jgi:hypothetical protein
LSDKKVGRPPGRPDLVKIPVGYKLPRWIVEWLRSQDRPAAVLIEESLTKRFKLQQPKGSGNGG